MGKVLDLAMFHLSILSISMLPRRRFQGTYNYGTCTIFGLVCISIENEVKQTKLETGINDISKVKSLVGRQKKRTVKEIIVVVFKHE